MAACSNGAELTDMFCGKHKAVSVQWRSGRQQLLVFTDMIHATNTTFLIRLVRLVLRTGILTGFGLKLNFLAQPSAVHDNLVVFPGVGRSRNEPGTPSQYDGWSW